MEVPVVIEIFVLGFGATLAMDLWRLLLQKGFGVNSLDLGLLGRWVGYLFRGQLLHRPIGKSTPLKGELALGWISHYAIGLTFAALLPLLFGKSWLLSPTALPALAIGVATVLAPWFIMQPAMGIGIAAAQTPSPWRVRVRNLAIHTVYGLGLYGTAAILNLRKTL